MLGRSLCFLTGSEVLSAEILPEASAGPSETEPPVPSELKTEPPPELVLPSDLQLVLSSESLDAPGSPDVRYVELRAHIASQRGLLMTAGAFPIGT
jgi:hypothetical protein